MNKYEVTITPKVQSYAGTWTSGAYTVDVYAKDRADAIKKARSQYKYENGSMDPATFKAKVAA